MQGADSSTAVSSAVWCDQPWTQSSCVDEAVCVPSKSVWGAGPDGQPGFCSCEYIDNTFSNRFTHDAQGNLVLECAVSDLSITSAVLNIALALYAWYVMRFLVKVLKRARKTAGFRWDVLGLSAVLLLLATFLIGATRVSRAVANLLVFQPFPAINRTAKILHIVLSVISALLGCGGMLFFAVATIATLEKSARLLGFTHQKKGSPVYIAKQIAILGSIFLGAALFVCFIKAVELSAIVIAIASVTLFAAFGLLARSLTSLLRSQPFHKSDQVAGPALAIFSRLSFRLRIAFVLLLGDCFATLALLFVGRAKLEPSLLRTGMTLTVIFQYMLIISSCWVMAVSLQDLWQAKMRQRKPSIPTACPVPRSPNPFGHDANGTPTPQQRMRNIRQQFASAGTLGTSTDDDLGPVPVAVVVFDKNHIVTARRPSDFRL